jgi:hypothetical protein
MMEKIRKRNMLASTVTQSMWKKCGEEMGIARWSTLGDRTRRQEKIDISGRGIELCERVDHQAAWRG